MADRPDAPIAPEVPLPNIVRERIARGERELRLLRALYRLSRRAAVERAEHARYYFCGSNRTDEPAAA